MENSYVRVPTHKFQNDFGRIHGHSHQGSLFCSYDIMELNGIVTIHNWPRQWLEQVHWTDWERDLCMECPLQFTSYLILFSGLFHIPLRDCPCIVEIRGTGNHSQSLNPKYILLFLHSCSWHACLWQRDMTSIRYHYTCINCETVGSLAWVVFELVQNCIYLHEKIHVMFISWFFVVILENQQHQQQNDRKRW